MSWVIIDNRMLLPHPITLTTRQSVFASVAYLVIFLLNISRLYEQGCSYSIYRSYIDPSTYSHTWWRAKLETLLFITYSVHCRFLKVSLITYAYDVLHATQTLLFRAVVTLGVPGVRHPQAKSQSENQVKLTFSRQFEKNLLSAYEQFCVIIKSHAQKPRPPVGKFRAWTPLALYL